MAIKFCKYICFIVFSFILTKSEAQIPLGVTTNVLPPYPSEFSVWTGNAGNYFINIQNNSDLNFEIYVRVSLIGTAVDGEPVEVKISDNYRPVSGRTIPSFGNLQLMSSDIEEMYGNLGIPDLDLTPNVPLDLEGELPSGVYKLCAEVIEFNPDPTAGINFLSPVICSEEFVVSTNNIELIWPGDGDLQPDDSPINFLWNINSTTGIPIGDQEYRLRIYELDALQAEEESIYELIESGDLPPVFTSNDLFETSFLYDSNFGQYPLTSGNQYAAQVEVVESDDLFYENNKKSNINAFYYGPASNDDPDEAEDDLVEISDDQQDCFDNCVLSIPDNTNLSNSTEWSTLKVGHFEIIDLKDLIVQDDSNYSGSGRIKVPFLGSENGSLYVNVNFENVKVNTDGEIIEGEVAALVDEIPQPGDLPSEEVFNDFIKTNRMVGSILGAETTMNLPIGINQNLLGSYFLIGMTSMKFSPTGASIDVKCNIHLPQFGTDNWIAFSSSNMCVHPEGWGGEFLMHMDYDRVIKFKDQIEFTFKGMDAESSEEIMDEACFLQMDCNGIKSLALQASIGIPGEFLLKEDEYGLPASADEPLEGSMSILLDREVEDSQNVYIQNSVEEADDYDDSGFQFIAKIALDSFQIKNLTGWGFSVKDVWFDGSELVKVPDMQFPEDYDGWDINGYDNTTNINPLWTGIYIEQLEIRSPKEFLGGDQRATASINHAIIDPKISMTVRVDSLFGINYGNIDNWQFSLENLFLDVEQGRFESGGFEGRIGMPFTGEDEYLEYSAIIQDSEDNAGTDPLQFVFSINPQNNITIPLMIAEAELFDNSYIEAAFTPNDSDQTYFSAGLFGEVNIDTETLQNSGTWEENGGLPLKLPLLNFGFDYHSKEGFKDSHFSFLDGLTLSEHTEWTSNQITQEGKEFGVNKENIAGLPISIESINLNSTTVEEAVFTILPRVVLGGDEFTIAGQTTLNLTSQIGGTQKFSTPSFSISAITIQNDIAGLYCEGSLEFYNSIDDNPDGVGAKGVKGDLEVLLPMGIGMKMAAEFGTQVNNPEAEFGTANNFPYWYLDGMVYLGEAAGIPIAPGIGVYGLGGGVCYNMTRSSYVNAKGEADQAAIDGQIESLQGSSPNQVNRTGNNPTVAHGTMGFKLAGTFGTHPSPKAFNADVSFEAEFSSGIGISLLSVRGSAYLMTPLGDRNNASVYANAFLTYENLGEGNKAFMGGIDVFVNTDMIYGDPDQDNKMVSATFLAESINKRDKWYFHVGSPDDPGELNVDLIVITAKATGYFMLGHDLPTTLPIPEKVTEFFENSNSSGGSRMTSDVVSTEEERSEHAISMAESGIGLAFGVAAEAEIDLDAFGVYAKLGIFLGVDVNVTKSDGATCYIPGEGNIVPGINGWYGNGQVYAGLEGELGFRVKAFGNDHDLRLFYLGAAMMLRGGGPNPTWAEGRMGLRIEVLGGLIKCNKSVSVKVGDICVPPITDPFGGVPPIVQHYPLKGDKKISPLSNPSVDFTFPMGVATPIPTLQNNGIYKTMYITPEVIDVEVLCKKDDRIVPHELKWSDEDRHMKIDLTGNATANSRVEVSMRLIAFESDKSWDKGSRVEIDGQDWQLDTMYHYRTGEATTIDEAIVTTVPGRLQKNFLPKQHLISINKVVLDTGLEEADYLFTEDDDNTYEYFFRFTPFDESGEIVETAKLNFSSFPVDEFVYGFQYGEELQTDQLYSCQLIRQGTPINGLSTISNLEFKLTDEIVNLHKVESTTEVIFQNSPPPPGEEVGRNEFALMSYYFRTSKYEDAEDKLENLDFEHYNTYIDKMYIHCDDEGFDNFDLYGEYFEDELVQAPVFEIVDPFYEVEGLFNTSPNYYYKHVDEKFYDFKEKFQTKKENFGWDSFEWPTGDFISWGLNSILAGETSDTLSLAYEDDMETILNMHIDNHDDIFGAGLLTGEQIDAEWAQALVDAGHQDVEVPGFLNWKLSWLYLPTFHQVTNDAQVLLDWGATLLSVNYLYNHDIGADWPKFENEWLDQISVTYEFASYHNPGTYRIEFRDNRTAGYPVNSIYRENKTKTFTID